MTIREIQDLLEDEDLQMLMEATKPYPIVTAAEKQPAPSHRQDPGRNADRPK